MSLPIVSLTGVSKSYNLYGSPGQLVADQFGLYRLVPQRKRPSWPVHHALQDVDLSIASGERVGIVGRNGAGKSTLLKLLIGNVAPSAGSIRVSGRVDSIMQSGLGLTPTMTGLQNIHAALVYRRLSPGRRDEAVADIIEFCELGPYLTQQVSTYSLGMVARLQFAIATAINPDVLVIDEVLGAGDAYFTLKSAARIRTFAENGCTLLIVSHSMKQILQFCERVVWLDRGRIVMDGPAPDVIDAYEAYLEHLDRSDGDSVAAPQPEGAALRAVLSDGRTVNRWPGRPGIRFDRVDICDADGQPVSTVEPDQPLQIMIDVKASETRAFHCKYIATIWTPRAQRVIRYEHIETVELERGATRSFIIPVASLNLGAGNYLLSFSIDDLDPTATLDGRTRFDTLTSAVSLQVRPSQHTERLSYVHPAKWVFGVPQ